VPNYWVNTRTLRLLDAPVTLAPGHIRTGDFKINVAADFSVQIKVPYNRGPRCEAAGLRTRRLTSIGGQPIAAPGTVRGADRRPFLFVLYLLRIAGSGHAVRLLCYALQQGFLGETSSENLRYRSPSRSRTSGRPQARALISWPLEFSA
jgi:hypothetical protein